MRKTKSGLDDEYDEDDSEFRKDEDDEELKKIGEDLLNRPMGILGTATLQEIPEEENEETQVLTRSMLNGEREGIAG